MTWMKRVRVAKSVRVTRIALVAVLAVVLFAGTAAGLATGGSQDGFEDGNIDGWNISDTSGGSISASTDQAVNGSWSMRMQTDGQADNRVIAVTRTDLEPGNIKDGEIFRAWHYAEGVEDQRYRLYATGGSLVSAWIANGHLYVRGDERADVKLCDSCAPTNTWFMIEIRVYDDGREEIFYKNADGSVIASDTGRSWSVNDDFTAVYLDYDDDGDYSGVKNAYWDDVTYKTVNAAPTVENVDTTPADPVAGDDVNVTADISDPDGDSIAWAGASVWMNGTLAKNNVTQSSISGGTYEWKDLVANAKKDTDYNVSIKASDGSAITTETVNFSIKDTAPQVTVNQPQNRTYFDYDQTYNFTASDTDGVPGENYTCTVDQDGSTVSTETGMEDLAASGTFRADLGSNTINVSCDDDAGNTGWDAEQFTVQAYELLDNKTATSAYETENTSYNISLRLGDMVAGANTTLYWNGSAVNSMMLDSSGVRIENATHNFSPPLVSKNRTNASWNFDYDVHYTFENGTENVETLTAPAGTQEVWLAYFVENFNITKDRVIEALDLTASFDIVQLGEAQADTNSSIEYNGTTKSGTNATFPAYIIPNQSVQSVTTTASGATTFTFKNSQKTLSTASDNITIHNKILTDCSAGSASQTEAIKFILLDETNWQNSINGEVMYNFDTTVKGRDTDNFAFGTRSGSSIPTCIYPTWAEYRITGPIQYQATDYTDRTYNLYNVTVNNQSETYDLYLLPSNQSTSIFLKVVDSGGQPVSGVTIQVLRYFIGKDAYVTIAKSETDSEGLTSTYMKVNEIYYKYIVTRNGTVLQETDRQILACSATPCTKTIKINPTTVDPYYKKENNFASDCWTNGDSTFQCTVTYKGAAPQKARLVVDELLTLPGATNRTCDITVESTTSSLVCNVGNLSTSEYQYVLTGYVDGEEYVLQQGTIGVTKAIFDDNIVFAFLVFLAITGLGYRRPSQTILFATLGFFATAWLKLFTVSAGILAGVGIIALLLIIQMERL